MLVLISEFNKEISKNSGATLSLQQFYGMLIKKFIQAYRNIAIAIAQLAVPAAFTLIAITAARIVETGVADKPALALNLAPFRDNRVTYSNGTIPTSISTEMAKNYKVQFDKTVWVNRNKYPQMDDFFGQVQENIGLATFNR